MSQKLGVSDYADCRFYEFSDPEAGFILAKMPGDYSVAGFEYDKAGRVSKVCEIFLDTGSWDSEENYYACFFDKRFKFGDAYIYNYNSNGTLESVDHASVTHEISEGVSTFSIDAESVESRCLFEYDTQGRRIFTKDLLYDGDTVVYDYGESNRVSSAIYTYDYSDNIHEEIKILHHYNADGTTTFEKQN